MKKNLMSLVSVLALTLMTACGSEAAASGSKAAGVYEIDKVALKQAALDGMPEEARSNPEATKMMDAMFETMVMTVELKEDGTCEMNGSMEMMGQKSEKSAKGTWKLDGDQLTMTTEDDTGKKETKTVTLKDGKFSIEEDMAGKKQTITFVRKKA